MVLMPSRFLYAELENVQRHRWMHCAIGVAALWCISSSKQAKGQTPRTIEIPAAGDMTGFTGQFELELEEGGVYAAGEQGSWLYAGQLQGWSGHAGDRVGHAVDMSADAIIVGAYFDDELGNNAGAVYVISTYGGATDAVKLLASDGTSNSWFGESVAIEGDTLLVGARGDDQFGVNAGSVYCFMRDDEGRWHEVGKFGGSDTSDGDAFGDSVALSGSTAMIGAEGDNDLGSNSGSVFVFDRGPDGIWQEVQKLHANDAQPADLFGNEVALEGDWAVIGSPHDDDGGKNTGSAYIFEKADDGVWRQFRKLLASDGQAGDTFGASVAIFGNTIVVGTPEEFDFTSPIGVAYIFHRDQFGDWTEQQKITAGDVAPGYFGSAVAVDRNSILVGARNADAIFVNSGAAYVFERDRDGLWVRFQELTAPDGAANDKFGTSVSLWGDWAIVGAEETEGGGTAYVFGRERLVTPNDSHP